MGASARSRYASGVRLRLRPLLALAAIASTLVASAPGGPAHADPASASARPASPAPALAGHVEEARKAVEAFGGTLGLAVVDLESGALVAQVDAATPRNPASNAKLPTAIAALERLGPQHRFVTGLYGAVDDAGRVPTLVLRGRGDPTLRDADLWEMARELVVAGVKRVDAIAVDQGAGWDRWVPPAFEQQPAEWAPFRANVAPLSVDGNLLTFWVRPGSDGKPAAILVDPPGAATVEGSVTTGAPRSAEAVRLDLRADKGAVFARFGGRLPAGHAPLPIVRRADDPRRLAGLVMREALRGVGVQVGDAVSLGGAGETRALVVRSSPPLSEVLPMLGKDSDNFVAEMLLLALTPPGKPATPEAGAAVVRDVLERHKALDPGTAIVNGSGLFDANRLSPRSLATLLASSWRDPAVGPEVVSHLAIGGVDGTLRGRLRRWSDERAIRAKTGTLAATVALSGYVLRPEGGRPLAFSVIVSDCRGKSREAREAIDAFVDGLTSAAWRR